MIVTYPCRYGTISIDSGDNPIQASLKEYGEWAQNEINFLFNYLQKGDTIIHAGAHVGTLLLAFSLLVGEKGHVYSFEPQNELYRLASSNIEINEISNVSLFKHALGSHNATYWMNELSENAAGNRGATAISESSIGHCVEVRTLDSLNLELSSCRLVHLDIEDYELKALEGMSKFMLKYKPLLFLENRAEAIPKGIADFLTEANYEYELLSFPAYNPENFLGNPKDIFSGALEKSIFCRFKD